MSNLKIFNKKKKTYVLILEFSAEISKKLKIEDKEKEGYFKQLLKKLLKNDRAVFELYKHWLMIDICFNAQAYEMDKDKSLIKDKHEIDIISPVIDTLPGDAKEHFNKMIGMYDDPSDLIKYFRLLFNRFGLLKVEKANFIEKGK